MIEGCHRHPCKTIQPLGDSLMNVICPPCSALAIDHPDPRFRNTNPADQQRNERYQTISTGTNMTFRSSSPASTTGTLSRTPTPTPIADPPRGSYAPIPLPSGRTVFEYYPATDEYFVVHKRVIFYSPPRGLALHPHQQPLHDSGLALDVHPQEPEVVGQPVQAPAILLGVGEVKPAKPVVRKTDMNKPESKLRDFEIPVSAYYPKISLDEAVGKKERQVMGWEIRSWGSSEWDTDEDVDDAEFQKDLLVDRSKSRVKAGKTKITRTGAENSRKGRKRVKFAEGSDETDVEVAMQSKKVKEIYKGAKEKKTAGQGEVSASELQAVKSEETSPTPGRG